MGKHAQYVKRGSSTSTGFLPAPLAADWALGTPTTTDVLATLTVSIPTGADRWGVIAIRVSTAVPQTTNVSIGSTITVLPLLPSVQYRALAAWFKSSSNIQVSEWSAPKIFTTLT